MGVGSLHGNVKELAAEDVGGTDTSADHGRPCPVDTGVRPLSSAQSKLHNTVAPGGIADPGGFGGNQALVIDDV